MTAETAVLLESRMAVDFTMPDIGENIKSVEIGQLLVAEGDTITAGQAVVEIESDKAVMEIPCPHAGKVAKVHVKEGQSVAAGAVLFTIEPVGASKPAAPPAKPSEPGPSAPGVSAPPKSTPTPAPAVATATAVAQAKPMAESTNGDKETIPAGPAVRRLARLLGVDLRRVSGSGTAGRITADDVHLFLNRLKTTGGGGGMAPSAPLPDFTKWGEVEKQKLSKLARVSADHLAMCWQTIPHVTQHDLVDVTELEQGRKRFGEKSKSPAKITMTVLAIKAVVAALKQYPQFNASIDMTTGELILKRYYHIGVAVDTEQGLLVPVVRDADKKSIVELAIELNTMAEAARNRKLTLDQMQGGTFTISNLGGIGGTAFTPIVNHPEVAILGISRSRWEQVMLRDSFEPRLMLPLSLSYDHRVINGADGARFITKIASLFLDPVQFLIEA